MNQLGQNAQSTFYIISSIIHKADVLYFGSFFFLKIIHNAGNMVRPSKQIFIPFVLKFSANRNNSFHSFRGRGKTIKNLHVVLCFGKVVPKALRPLNIVCNHPIMLSMDSLFFIENISYSL